MARVSVLIAARNRKAFLPECIASARRQTYRDLEIILVDDGSTDGTPELARLPDVYRRTPPLSCAHARNLAMDLARGDYLYVLDSDDYLAPNALQLSVETIERSGADMVFSELLFVRENRVVGLYGAREQTVEEVVEGKMIPHGSSMMRRSTLAVRYDETLASAEDLDFLLRWMPGKVLRMLPAPIYYYRIHPMQESASRRQSQVAQTIRARWHERRNAAVSKSTAEGE
jgi:glycosyltransferase involved in cell wall biosynthesis